MRIEPEISAAAIVMVGHFNPQIFQPFWLAHHDVISEEAAESATIGFVHSEVTSFKLEEDFHVQVQRERFYIDRSVAPLIRIADVACRIFGELLPHTPISQVGINRLLHFSVGSEDAREQIGLKLAPREPWGEWGRLVTLGEGVKHGGMASLTMIQREVPDRSAGWVQTKVEPSNVLRGRSGIYVEVNDHYDLGRIPEGADEIVEIIRTKFDASIANSDSIVDQIMSLQAMNRPWRSTDFAADSATPIDTELAFEDKITDSAVRRVAQLEVSRFDAGAKIQAPASSNGDVGLRSTSIAEIDPPKDIGADLRALAGVKNFFRPVSMNPVSPKARPTTFSPVQEWEGYVVEVVDNHMVANLVDLTAHDKIPSSTVEIPLAELNPVDIKRLRPGLIFRWAIGYHRTPSGTKSRGSNIVFRDLPQWTKQDLISAKREAAEMAEYFDRSDDESSIP